MVTHSSILAWRVHMDRETWWATVHGVTKSWTRLKRLSTQSERKFTLRYRWSSSEWFLLHDSESSSLRYTLGPCCLVCIYWFVSANPNLLIYPSLTPLSPGNHTFVFRSMNLFLCHKSVHLCHILDSTYTWYRTVFVFLWLTSFSVIISSSIYLCCCKWHYFILLYG